MCTLFSAIVIIFIIQFIFFMQSVVSEIGSTGMEYGSTKRKYEYEYESGQGLDPTLGAAFVAFYIVLLSISSTKTKDHHNKAVVFINYLFWLLYYKKRFVLKMNSCTAKNTCLFS